jgi:hypothetical protein
MKGKVVEDFGVFTVEVINYKEVGIKDRKQKENELVKRYAGRAGLMVFQSVSHR